MGGSCRPRESFMAEQKPIVVDGSTVAYEERSKKGKPKDLNLTCMCAPISGRW